MIRTLPTIEMTDLPEDLKADVRWLLDYPGMNTFYKLDIMSDKVRDDWLEDCPDRCTKIHCRLSDFFRSQGAPVGPGLLLIWW